MPINKQQNIRLGNYTWYSFKVLFRGKLAAVTLIPPLFDSSIFWHNEKRYRLQSNNFPLEKWFYVPARNGEEAILLLNQSIQKVAPLNQWKSFEQYKIYSRFHYNIETWYNTGQQIVQFNHSGAPGGVISVNANNQPLTSLFEGYIKTGELKWLHY